MRGKLLKQVNDTVITFVPKFPNAECVNEYRPIACWNTGLLHVVIHCINVLLKF